VTKTKEELNQYIRRSFLKIPRKFPRVAKSWYIVAKWWYLPLHGYGAG